MKKAQMEIMGLAIIVILISLAMLFVVRFIILRPESTFTKTYMHEQLAANTLNSLLITTTDCYGKDIAYLLSDCANYNGIGNFMCPENQLSCDYAKEKIKFIFENTLDKWNKAYEFYVSLAKINITSGDCIGEKQSETYIKNTGTGIMTITLRVCG